LPIVVEKSSNPGPFTLICRPAIHNPEGMLAIIINSLLFFSNSIIAIVADGIVLSTSTACRVATFTSAWNIILGGRVV
jgi:hypothetical protein